MTDDKYERPKMTWYGAVGESTTPPIPDTSQMAHINELESIVREVAGNIDACCCLDGALLDRMERALGIKVYTSYMARTADRATDEEDTR